MDLAVWLRTIGLELNTAAVSAGLHRAAQCGFYVTLACIRPPPSIARPFRGISPSSLMNVHSFRWGPGERSAERAPLGDGGNVPRSALFVIWNASY